MDQDGPATVKIEAAADGQYQATVHDGKSGGDSLYDIRLVTLGNNSFADCLLSSFRHGGQGMDLPPGAVMLHEFVKYRLTGDELYLGAIDGGALDTAEKQQGFPLEFRTTEDSGDTVILSRTDELRRYFSAHPNDLFGTEEHLRRQR